MNSKRLEQIQDNRDKLKTILNTIIALGRQNIPLRGHSIKSEINQVQVLQVNERNLREILGYRIQSPPPVLL